MSALNDADLAFVTEMLPLFVSESNEQLEQVEQLLLQLETRPDDRTLLDGLFRCVHTVKGSAGVFGLDDVEGFTHHVETLLDRLRNGDLALTPALSTVLLQCNDEIRALVAQAQSQAAPEADATAARADLLERLQAVADGPSGSTGASAVAMAAAGIEPIAAVATTDGAWKVHIAFGEDTLRSGMDPVPMLGYLARSGEIRDLRLDLARIPPLDLIDPEACHLALDFEVHGVPQRDEIAWAFGFVAEESELSIEPLTVAAAPAVPATASIDATAAVAPAAAAGDAATDALARPGTRRSAERPTGDETRYIRVQADRLDAVINLLGELVIAGAGAALLARQTRQGRLVEANAQVSRLIEEIRNGTLQMRMVPIGETFSRFRRVVRDTAAELGKDVQLELEGGDTELDKSVVERIADPLMHLVRNALDHGLETPEQRRAACKADTGRLTLAACHESGQIVIRIRDDGRGIQRDKVLQRAWDRGLVERGVTPPDADIDELIFEPGFSTAEQVTNLSGRGVGMDVVRRNIEELRGSVGLSSTPGQGSVIEIRLPLTLAIIDGFLVGVGAHRFIFPLEAVVEVIERKPTVRALDARGRGLMELRGQALPLVSLRGLYALEGRDPERASVVVLQSGSRRFGVVVDHLLGQHQTVIKPLGRMFRSLRGMSGSSILGTGEVALIFDVHALGVLAAAHARGTPRLAAAGDAGEMAATTLNPDQRHCGAPQGDNQ